ncbi:uncharacterized protein [Apostichopus japonicus]|uniref:uncharacterized protein isoform X3 n=1 Tax=Stichopus japonicus TaxID=307972 RepID=UPI003AB73282
MADIEDSAVLNFLRKYEIESLHETFIENGIDKTALLLLKEDDIRDLIPKIGDRLKFQAGWKKESKVVFQFPLYQDEIPDVSSLSDADDLSTTGDSSTSVDTLIIESDADTSLEGSSYSPFHSPYPLKRQKRIHFDVEAILGQSSRGRKVMGSISCKKLCSKQDRHILVEICTSHMVDHYGDKPSSFIKAALAAAVVDLFPFLKDPESPLGYEAWYCKGAAGRPATGYLEEHLRYVRKKKIAMVKDSPGASSPPTPLTKVSTPPKLREADLENKEELVMMTEWLKCNMEPREKVLDFMRQTAVYRQQQIKDHSNNISDILKEYPRLLDRGMIEQDFSVLWPEHEDHLYEKWDLYYNGIIEYGKQVENWQGILGLEYVNLESLSIDKKKTLAFFLLPVILRGKGKGKKGLCSVKEAITSFVDIQPEVADILQISKTIDATKKPQPFVVCKGTLLAPTQTFVILERRPVPQESLLKAIDFCFKAMYILDMAYQPSCCLVWQFIQNVIYEIKEPHVPSCIRDLRSFLAFKSN